MHMRKLVPFLKSPPLVSVIRLSGQIVAGQRGLSDERLASQVERAFSKGKPAAVALLINSPGGSPVQSSLIAGRIRRLADEKEIPVYAFVEDVAASGGYYIASAADEIWVDRHSIIGSIGVITAGFGLNELIDRYGIQRRVYTAGKSKSLGDPFKPENPEDVKRTRELIDHIHGEFIDHVKTCRGDRLNADMDLFNADIWVGSKALPTGLIDGIGHLVPKMKEIYGDKVRFRHYGAKKPLLSRLGANMIDDALTEVETRAAFQRFGA